MEGTQKPDQVIYYKKLRHHVRLFVMPFNAEPPIAWSLRLASVLLIAISVSLPIALISISKILLFVTGLGYLTVSVWSQKQCLSLHRLWTTKAILLIVIAFALSLFWTEVDMEFALQTFVKHAKLLGILLLIFLIQSRREARMAITVFAIGQIFVLLNSWLLATGLTIPWVTNLQSALGTRYVVFAQSYIDQSIMFSVTAAILWHLRSGYGWPRWFAMITSLAALLNVFFLLPGRTGYLAAATVLTLALMWKMNKRLRLFTFLAAPFILALGFSFSTGQLHDRVFMAVHEVKSNLQQVETKSSSGWRLNAWMHSLTAIDERPWDGHGVGSWTPAIKRIQGTAATQVFGTGNSSNPHQEFLLWGVEIGVGGVLLLLALLLSVAKDARQFTPDIQRATLSVVAVVAVACLFNSALFDDLMGDFLYVAVGLLIALGLHESRQPGKISIES